MNKDIIVYETSITTHSDFAHLRYTHIGESNDNRKCRIITFEYNGSGDPVKHLDNAIQEYTKCRIYKDFIDANMDNPWVRIVIMSYSIEEYRDLQLNKLVSTI